MNGFPRQLRANLAPIDQGIGGIPNLDRGRLLYVRPIGESARRVRFQPLAESGLKKNLMAGAIDGPVRHLIDREGFGRRRRTRQEERRIPITLAIQPQIRLMCVCGGCKLRSGFPAYAQDSILVRDSARWTTIDSRD